MSGAEGEGPDPGLPLGQLARNGKIVEDFRRRLGYGKNALAALPDLVVELDEQDAWKAFHSEATLLRGGLHRWGPGQFREFVESSGPSGCRTPLIYLERLVEGTMAWDAYVRLTNGRLAARKTAADLAAEARRHLDDGEIAELIALLEAGRPQERN